MVNAILTGLVNYPSKLNGNGTRIGSVGIPQHGVVAFVYLQRASECTSWASDNDGAGRCGLWLAKFGSGGPSDEVAPAPPSGLEIL